MLAYPKQGSWFPVNNLLQAGELIEYASDHLITHDIIAKGFFGNKCILWFLNSQQKIRAFFWCMKECLGKTKVRMEAREKLP